METFRSFVPALLVCAAGLARAGLADPQGLWQLDGNFGSPGGSNLGTSTLTAGVDYSFGTEAAGYHFLQTQVWSAAKRLTVLNPSALNGGPGATRTNQWTVMMDVKFDAMQPYASVLQTNPDNTTDAPFFLSSANNLTGTLELLGAGSVSAAGAIPVNTWVRLAITCGNDGAGGPASVKCYINGVPGGTTRTAVFNGAASLAATFHLFTDENSEMKPTKLSSLAFWTETLSAEDIQRCGGPQAPGIRPHVSWINFAGLPSGPGYADGTGTAAHFSSPYGVAADASGQVFVTDTGNHVIRRISPAGTVTTLAGSPGNPGSADGSGTSARFQDPAGIAVDGAGNLYVADSANHTIRKVTPQGQVTTLTGRAGLDGLVNGDPRSARFREPRGVALDGQGNLLVADFGNSAIRKVVLANGTVSTLTAGASLFSEPQGVAVDGSGNIYVANTDDGAIIKINPAGVVTVLAQSPALGARSLGIAVDSGGNVHVTDFNGHGITRVTPAGAVSLIAGNQTTAGHANAQGTSARFRYPTGLAFDSSGHLVIADTDNHLIRRMDPVRQVTTLAGNPENTGMNDGVGSQSRFTHPAEAATDAAGNVYVADTGNHTVRKITPAGVVTTLAGRAGIPGSADGPGSAARFHSPLGVAVDAAGNVHVTDSYNHTLRKITPAGVVSTTAGTARAWGNTDGQGPAARFDCPSGIAVDAAGTVYVADFDGRRIRRITPGGLVSFFAGFPGDGSHVVEPTRFTSAHLATDPSGQLYRTIVNQHHVEKISAAGVITTYAGAAGTSGLVNGPRANARFNLPRGIACDDTGNLYVSDSNNNTVRLITAAGMVSTLGRQITFDSPVGIAVDRQGVIYLVDSGQHRISRGSPGTGTIGLTAWRQRYFGILTDSGNAANTLDFDQDGVVNLLEYALGTDPTSRLSVPALPAGGISGGNLQISFIPPAGRQAVTYGAEASSSMLSGRWTTAPRQLDQGTWRYGSALSDPPTRGFLRLRIQELPVTDAQYQSLTP